MMKVSNDAQRLVQRTALSAKDVCSATDRRTGMSAVQGFSRRKPSKSLCFEGFLEL